MMWDVGFLSCRELAVNGTSAVLQIDRSGDDISVTELSFSRNFQEAREH